MLPLNASQIPKLMQDARSLELSGRLEEARKRYEAVLAINRKHAPSHFQVGQIHYKLGDYARAADSLERAAELAPQQQAVWQLLAQTLQRIGDPARSDSFLRKAKKARLAPQLLVALQDGLEKAPARSKTDIGSVPPERLRRAIQLLQSGDAAGAERLAQALRDAHPDVAIVADVLGSAQAAGGKRDAAETQFRAAVALDPGYAEARLHLGRLLFDRGRPEEAIAQLEQALRIAPKMADAWHVLGRAKLYGQHDLSGAEAALAKALAVDPQHRHALMEMAHLLVTDRRHDAAIVMAERARKAGASPVETGLATARALSDAGRSDEALARIDAVLDGEPECGPAHAARAAVLQTLGRFDGARTAFRRALDLMPRSGETYRVFLLSEKLSADDPLIGKMQEVWELPDLRDTDRMHLGFALAKAMEDTGQHARVFTYLRPANDLMRKHYPYDVAERRRTVDAIRDAYAGADFAGREVADAPDYVPIFVTGLPRSGTTLVEQILASHSRVTGGGELDHARRQVTDLCADAGSRFRPLPEVSDAEFAAAGHAVADRMRAQFPGADIVTDKGVQSYVVIGLLRLALPRSRIVVVRRDPRDTLLSIYRNMFADGRHRYSYSLKDLGAYYLMFEELVAFWRDTLPGGFHEIAYEDLIADPEAQARALIAACGLDWEDGCLRFHENRRRVDTLSVHQVRQPIYRSSLKGWQRYRDDLGELFAALGPKWAPE